MEPSDLKSLPDSVIDICSQRAKSNNIELKLTCDDSLRLQLNPSLIEQAVVNLVDNAIKYSNPGGSVEIEARQGAANVTISVTDHGSGIERAHLPRLFERFYRVDQARSRDLGGTGLGLAIVKHIVTAHHGTVGVESTPGKGSTFMVSLPLSQAGLSGDQTA